MAPRLFLLTDHLFDTNDGETLTTGESVLGLEANTTHYLIGMSSIGNEIAFLLLNKICSTNTCTCRSYVFCIMCVKIVVSTNSSIS